MRHRSTGIARGPWLVTAAAMVVVSVISAGTAPAATGDFGFFGGVNLAKLGNDMEQFGRDLAAGLADELGGTWTSDLSTRGGLVIGGYYVTKLSPTIGLEFEVQYVQRGVTVDLSATNVPGVGNATVENTYKLDYIEAPILLRIAPNPTAAVRPVLLVGPVFGVRGAANMEVSVEGESASADIGEITSSTTLGFLGAAGLGFAVGETTTLVFQGRYYMGLTNALDDAQYTAKAQDFSIVAGVQFAPMP